MIQSRLFVLPLVALAVLLTACPSRGPAGPEVTEIPGLALDEDRLVATLEGTRSVQVRVPLRPTTDRAISGTIRLALVDLEGESDRVVGEAETDFAVDGEAGTFDLLLRGRDGALQGPDLARYLIRYEVETRSGRIHGARSLWIALPRAEIHLLAPTTLPAGGTTHARVYGRDAADGRPLAGAAVTVTYRSDDGASFTLAETTLDAAGSAALLLTGPTALSEGSLHAEVVADGPDGALTAHVERDAQIVRDAAVLLTTDKPRYQPGQTVHLRALSLDRADRTPDVGEVVFEAVDAEGNTVFRKRVETDAHGIAATILPLADELNFGEWMFRARAGGGVAERPVLVDRYRLPSFDVRLTTDKTHYRPGDSVAGAVQAHYFFGEIVEGAIEVEAQHGEAVLARTTGTLSDGGFTFEMQLPGQFANDDGRPVRVTLVARVTDTADQSADTSLVLPIAIGDLDLAAIAEGTLATGLPARVLVAVTDPSGAPIAAEVSVTATGAALDAETVTLDETGIGAILLQPFDAKPTLAITASASDGRTVTRDLSLTAREGDALVVHPDKAVYQPGETARIVVFAKSDDALPASLTVDLARGTRVVATHALSLENGEGEIVVPITAELAGAVTVEASFIARGSRVIADRRLLFVDGAGALNVDIQTPDSVRPGETGNLSLTVRDETGTGVPAAVGVAVVDRAVLALGGPRPGQEAAALAFADDVPAPVAGHAISSVLSGSEASREAAARLLFAAAGGRTPYGIDASSLRAEIAEANIVVEPRFARTVAQLRDLLVNDVERGLMSHENAATWIADRAGAIADVFGQPLSADGGDLSSFAIRSRGLDEVSHTAADLQAHLDVWQILREGQPRTNDCWLFPCGGGGGDRAEEDFMDAEPAAGWDEDGAPPPDGTDDGGTSPTRVRSFFPETLLFAPSVITSSTGEATVPFPAADSITTWAVTASASTLDGRLGGGEGDLVVFQDFFVDVSLPPAITRGDEIEIPVAVYNYLDAPITVTVEAMDESWYTLLSPAVRTISLEPGEVLGTRFRIRAEGVGMKSFGVWANGGSVSDAIRRGVLVEPGGERIEDGSAGPLEAGMPSVTEVHFPEGAVTGSERLFVTVYPGVMAQAVQSMEAIVREPHGCFEQSTSATWPNVMVAQYMEATGENEGEAWDRTVGHIQKGHQMLVSYQSPTGGFNWWGNDDPGNRILTAIGILILRDMDGIIEIDEAVVRRNAEWLAGEQQGDGAWPTGDALHAGNEFLGEDAAIATSFAVQALIAAGGHDDAVQRGVSYLAGRVQSGIDAPFTLAATARTLAMAGSSASGAANTALVDIAEIDADGRFTWEAPGNASWTGASGRGAGIETTAVAAQSFLTAGSHPSAAEGALDFLATQVDGFGGWSQTQATVQSIRAFVQSLTSSGDTNVLGEIRVTVDGDLVDTLPVSPADADVVRTVDLREYAVPGTTREVELELVGEGRLMYQVVGVHHMDWSARPGGGLAVEVDHGQTNLSAGERSTVTVSVENQAAGTVDQVLVKVGLAPGMTPAAANLDAHVQAGLISRWERSATGVVLYLPAIQAGATRELAFGTMATVAGELEAPATVAYQYYTPDAQAVFPPVAFTVIE